MPAALLLLTLLHGGISTMPSCPLGYDYADVPHAGDDSDGDPLLYHPRFHLMPPTRKHRPTGMNDINAMFFHEGVYHVTYQDHINCPDDGGLAPLDPGAKEEEKEAPRDMDGSDEDVTAMLNVAFASKRVKMGEAHAVLVNGAGLAKQWVT